MVGSSARYGLSLPIGSPRCSTFLPRRVSKVLIEAAACGRGVVTTDVPGCRDAIEQNVTGLLVPPRDPDALADAVLNLIDDPVRMRTLGVEARKYAEEKFSIDFVRDAHMEIYEKLMASSK